MVKVKVLLNHKGKFDAVLVHDKDEIAYVEGKESAEAALTALSERVYVPDKWVSTTFLFRLGTEKDTELDYELNCGPIELGIVIIDAWIQPDGYISWIRRAPKKWWWGKTRSECATQLILSPEWRDKHRGGA